MSTKVRDEDRGSDASGVTLGDDACPACGTEMTHETSPLDLPVHGETVSVPDVAHLACPRCGEIVLDRHQAQVFHRAAIEAYRAAHGLLSAAEIRTLRERHGLSQGELASLLHLGANTLSRWEAGRNAQSSSMDMLLRLVRDVPATLDYLRRRAA